MLVLSSGPEPERDEKHNTKFKDDMMWHIYILIVTHHLLLDT